MMTYLTGNVSLHALTTAGCIVTEAVAALAQPRHETTEADVQDLAQHEKVDDPAEKYRPEFFPMSDVRIDGGTQTRLQIDDAVVADYAEALRDGAKLPPVLLYHEKEVDAYWLADGFHRFHAHRLIGRTDILAYVRDGTLDEALLHAAGANDAHGLRRTNADKRNSVQMVLANPKLAQKSDREIARYCKVSASLVADVRKAICTNNADSPIAPASRIVTRNGTTYQQKVKDKPTSAAALSGSADMSSDECGADHQPSMTSVPPQGGEVEEPSSDGNQPGISKASKPDLMSGIDSVPDANFNELLAEAQEEIMRLTAQFAASCDQHKGELQREIVARAKLKQCLDEVLEREGARDEHLQFLGDQFAELGKLLGVAGAKNIVACVRALVAAAAVQTST